MITDSFKIFYVIDASSEFLVFWSEDFPSDFWKGFWLLAQLILKLGSFLGDVLLLKFFPVIFSDLGSLIDDS